MAKKKILIIGAGLAGLSAAWHLQRRGYEPTVFEKSSQPGGLCRSKTLAGFTFDCDGHLLHFRHRYTYNLVKRLLGDNLAQHRRSAWVYSHRRYIRYPFQANLHGLPLGVAQECLLGYLQRNGLAKNHDKLNFGQWIIHEFGRGIAKHFMLPYNAKFWTVPPHDLTCDWLAGFIPVPSLRQVVEGTVKESHRQFGYNATFWYPRRGGIYQLPRALAQSVKHLHTNVEITGIDLDNKVVTTASGRQEAYDYAISTVPLPEIASLAAGLPRTIKAHCKRLRWNSIFNLNLGINSNHHTGRHWIYFPEKNFSFFRVGFYHNFSNHLAPADTTSLYVEVSYSKEKPIHKAAIIANIKHALHALGIPAHNGSVCVQDSNDITYGYPLYDRHYQVSRRQIIQFLERRGVFPCGRYGSWRYFSMEDAILDGRRAAEMLKTR
jgi:protoporphyrinogen oxidase